MNHKIFSLSIINNILTGIWSSENLRTKIYNIKISQFTVTSTPNFILSSTYKEMLATSFVCNKQLIVMNIFPFHSQNEVDLFSTTTTPKCLWCSVGHENKEKVNCKLTLKWCTRISLHILHHNSFFSLSRITLGLCGSGSKRRNVLKHVHLYYRSSSMITTAGQYKMFTNKTHYIIKATPRILTMFIRV